MLVNEMQMIQVYFEITKTWWSRNFQTYSVKLYDHSVYVF